ncbi:MFS transporter [Pelagibius sp. 7325]|uniref:MFS transporter n=1 Tax=Pelagibius sp. 7325 TaxID=3131994 RepID=UPI0030EB7E28
MDAPLLDPLAGLSQNHAPGDRPTDWASVTALITCISIFGLALGLTYPLLAIMMVAAGFSDFMIGLNGATTCVGVILAVFFLPSLLERFGAFAVLVLGLAGAAASLVAMPFTDPHLAWFPLRILLGFCLNAIFVVSEAWLNAVTAERIRGRVIGVYATVMAGGFALGPLLLVALGGAGLTPFLVCAGITAAAILLVLPLRRRSAAELTGMNLAGLARFLAAGALLAGVVMVFAFFDAAVMTLIPVYLLRAGFTADFGSAALSALLAGMVLAQFPVGWLLDRFSRPAVIATCALVAAACCALLPWSLQTAPVFWPLMVILGGASFALYTGALTVLGERFRGTLLMAGSACFALAYGTGGTLGPLAGGAVLQSFGPHAMPMLFAVVFLALALLVARRPLTRAQVEASPG